MESFLPVRLLLLAIRLTKLLTDYIKGLLFFLPLITRYMMDEAGVHRAQYIINLWF